MNHACLTTTFSLREKLWAQVSFLAMGVTGTLAIALAPLGELWIWPYVALYWYGVPMVIMRHLACPRCAHLYVYDDCLQAPPRLTRFLVKARKDHPFTAAERVLFLAILLGLPLYPLPWLLHRPVWLALFLAAALAWYGGQLLNFCRRCRVQSCPFNRAASTQAKPGAASGPDATVSDPLGEQ